LSWAAEPDDASVDANLERPQNAELDHHRDGNAPIADG
jgi:hypothetical protein